MNIEMKKYTGTKTIKGAPLSRGDYNKFQGWDIPEDENPEDPGYLVGYSNAEGDWGGPLQFGCHHLSWSPKDVFESTYRSNIEEDRIQPSTVKSLHNSEVSGAKINVKDLKIVGNGDAFQLLFKASSEKEGWMKSTKAMATGNGCLVQVTTQQRNADGSYAVAEALSFVPGVIIVPDKNNGRKLAGRQ